MEPASHLDDCGRLTIRWAYRKLLRGRVVQILTTHGVLLRPVLETLPDRGRIPAALRANGEAEAEAEAGKTRTPRT